FIHGFGADSQSWVANVPAVTEIVEAVGVDLPAHGLSADIDMPDSLDQIATQVIDSIDTSAPCIFIGHSAGGAIAMMCSARVEVRALGLVSPVGLGGGPDRSFIEQLPLVDTEAQALSLLQSMVENKRLIASPVVARLLEQLQRPHIRERWQRFASLLLQSEQELIAARQQLLKRGVLPQVVWGGADAINPLSESLWQCLPGDWQRFDSCGHLPHIERWSAYNKALINYLESRS
ncbi:MAG: alpha/beta fold hydrolase, partial [Pseudomonadota bacterium]